MGKSSLYSKNSDSKRPFWRRKETRLDTIAVCLLFLLMSICMYVTLGYAKYGIYAPLSYSGGDDFAVYMVAKTIGENGWNWFNYNLGAPFYTEFITDPSMQLDLFEKIVTKIFYIFTKDAIATVNLRFIFIAPTCALTSFLVMRALKINRFFSIVGGVLYGLTPFIFMRGVHHITVSTIYFVPLSMLVCAYCMEKDPHYLIIDKKFFSHPKNSVTLLCCVLIASNGLYNIFFACYFLCVTTMILIFSRRRIKEIFNPIKCLILIVSIDFIQMLPSFVYCVVTGSSPGTFVLRSMADGEIYGLKIAQLFIPNNAHGIEILQKVINYYNGAPLITENSTAYLGVAGIVGFVISILITFKCSVSDDDTEVGLFSKFNVFAILYGTIGGFSSLLYLIGFRTMRSFNRISVFISFASIFILMYYIQILWEHTKNKSALRKTLVIVMLGAFFAVSVYDVIPQYGENNSSFEESIQRKECDGAFVQEIENQLEENAMVFQLPYYEYPHSAQGTLNNMGEFQLFSGYLNSKALRWNYGFLAGSAADEWNQIVGNYPFETMIETICEAGFTGLYIETRAYTPDQLPQMEQKFCEVLGTEPLRSTDGTHIFYNLGPYISRNNMALVPEILDVKNLKKSYLDLSALFTEKGIKMSNAILLDKDTLQFGPYITLLPGDYRVEIEGDHLDCADFDCCWSGGQNLFELKNFVKTSNRVTYEITVFETAGDIEFRTFNRSDTRVAVYGLLCEKIE